MTSLIETVFLTDPTNDERLKGASDPVALGNFDIFPLQRHGVISEPSVELGKLEYGSSERTATKALKSIASGDLFDLHTFQLAEVQCRLV